ncbi:MAG TPA: hypothetical protein VHB79_36820 [Polyangiaceae bacterium]|nr:hypothetical protein [Polyangiaceae bacterium]
MAQAPRRLLLNDEGSSAVHLLDLDAPERCWSFSGPGRDLQLIGGERILRSTPQGYLELALEGGQLVREVSLAGVPAVESARRLSNGHTLVLGNGEGGIYLQELDGAGKPIAGRRLLCEGALKGRLVRPTPQGTWLFCSDTDGRRVIHEADFEHGARELFVVPKSTPADSMLKALRVAPDRVLVSSGYAASLLVIDTARGEVVQTIGGKTQAEPAHLRRPLSPNFFSGYQVLSDGSYLIANWQGHGPSHARDGYQVLMYSATGELTWTFDQTEYPRMTSLNNVIALDGLDTSRLHEEPSGVLTAM